MSVDAVWDWSGELRLLFEMQKNPGTADLARLFASDRTGCCEAYGSSVALIADVQRRHGGVPGGIAGRVADGVLFDRAFEPKRASSRTLRPPALPPLPSLDRLAAPIDQRDGDVVVRLLLLAAVAYAGR